MSSPTNAALISDALKRASQDMLAYGTGYLWQPGLRAGKSVGPRYIPFSTARLWGLDESARSPTFRWNGLWDPKDFGTSGDSKLKTKKVKQEKFSTIGVRFLEGMDTLKVYSYKVRPGAKVHLGQELVADTPRGPSLVVAVRIDKTPHIDASKYIDKKAVAL